ncbi:MULTISPECIES: undecaprenyl-phosphate galactose phosphotransferase WbaP [unclassified Limnohabitans]|uniref:undecaprenyl-phosphate galactose phosphotransferase WbaP n=1 Tax=unclassified Limnohabitans TaxID=2626134 RepID=UPI001304E567|nr:MULTISPECIES: undecaprenyl-phosphate galactose phosphotransferase WbaP [unclassified Limnohabitans]
MNKLHTALCAIGLLLADMLAWVLSYRFAAQDLLPIGHLVLLAGLWAMWFMVVRRHYFRRQPFWSELLSLFKGTGVFMALGYIGADLGGVHQTPLAYGAWGVALAMLLPLGRVLMRQTLQAANVWERQAVIFGAGENAQQAALALRSEPSLGYALQCFVQPDCAPRTADPVAVTGAPCKPWPQSAEDFAWLRQHHCIVALEAEQSELRDQLIRQLSHHQVRRVSVIPAMRGVPLFGLQTTQFFSHEVLMIHVRNNLMNPLHRWTKRIFDVTGALCLIGILSPLMLWVAYKIWRSDGTPVIFSQPRVGKDLKTFKFYKFRSMVKNAEDMLKQWEATNSREWQEYTANNFKLANDPRLISIGAFIRRTSIDELPQLFNVLRGEMSLVGPRPLLPREQTDYGDDLSLYAQTPPGLTGLWQISGRSQTTFEDRVIFDTWYVKNWSIWTDITILFKTWSVVFKRRGAY